MNISEDHGIMCIILSAGRSERFRAHKASLPFSEKETFLQHIVKQYHEAGVQNIIAVMNPVIKTDRNESCFNGVKFVENNDPGRGRLYSVYVGLKEAKNANHCFIQNIDNPFVSPELLFRLYTCRKRADFISPVFSGKGGHPILVSSKVINKILSLESFETTLSNILEKFSRYNVLVPDQGVLVNINTPGDYEIYFP